IGFNEAAGFDEREYSRRAASVFSSDHLELVLEPAQVIDAIPELVEAQDEPLSDWVCLPLKALARSVKDAGVTVVQVGEGSDELFPGYPRSLRCSRVDRRFWQPWLAAPAAVRRGGAALARALIDGKDGLREVRDLFDRAGHGDPIFVSGAVVNWDWEKAQL